MARGAVLIGYGSLPTRADVEDALKSGWVKNCDTITTTSFPDGTEPNRKLHFATYVTIKREKGWDDPGGLQAMKITTADGRTIYGVYPLAGSAPLSKASTQSASEQTTRKKWWRKLFSGREKPKAQAESVTLSPPVAAADTSVAQKDSAASRGIETQLKIIYARVEKIISRIPRDSEFNEWLGNFAKNLRAARTALADGQDMRGNAISRSDIAAGLRRMCDSYSGATSLAILGGVHGSSIRSEFEEILKQTLVIANTIAND